MAVLILTLTVFALAMVAMALGVMLTGRRLSGSCGGLSSGSCACKAAGKQPPESCPRNATEAPKDPGPLPIY